MSNSGDAAEQVVRLSLEGTEVALKLTGSAAKNIAAAIYAAFKNKDKTKTKGHQRLSAMLKSGKELKVFTVNEKNLKQFAKEAKRYGVVYCALKGKGKSSDGMVDIMVRAEDASKINRIVERFKLATVDTVSIKNEIIKSKAEKNTDMSAPEHECPDKSADDKQLDEELKAPIKKEEQTNENPSAARTEKSLPFEPTSEKQISAEEGTFKSAESKPSVRKELNEIKKSRHQRDKAEKSDKSKNQQKTASQNKPKNNKKKKAKER